MSLKKEKVLVAMSGGVDSSVAAALLREEGYDLAGAYMKNWVNEPGIAGDCPWQKDIEDAKAAAETIGIPFRIVNLMEEYKAKVVDYLLEGYRSGITPNPDAMCNREIKFGAFLRWALENGFDKVATGHYAHKVALPDGSFALHEGADKTKDQSYFLALLRQEQLARAVFPLGGLLKSEVRALAKSFGLPNAEKKDSQGICFIGQVKMSDFLRAYLPDRPGRVVDTEGRQIGEHRGLHLYTIGQGRGVGVPSPHHGRPYVVVAKNLERNELVMAPEGADAPGLYSDSCRVKNLSFVGGPPALPATLGVRPRYRAKIAEADIRDCGDGWEVVFREPQRALAPGQIAAFYRGERLIGGGFIA